MHGPSRRTAPPPVTPSLRQRELLWVKVKDFPWWPALVCDENDLRLIGEKELKECWDGESNQHRSNGNLLVRFFATYDCACASHKDIIPFGHPRTVQLKLEMQSTHETFLQAVQEAQEFNATGKLPDQWNKPPEAYEVEDAHDFSPQTNQDQQNLGGTNDHHMNDRQHSKSKDSVDGIFSPKPIRKRNLDDELISQSSSHSNHRHSLSCPQPSDFRTQGDAEVPLTDSANKRRRMSYQVPNDEEPFLPSRTSSFIQQLNQIQSQNEQFDKSAHQMHNGMPESGRKQLKSRGRLPDHEEGPFAGMEHEKIENDHASEDEEGDHDSGDDMDDMDDGNDMPIEKSNGIELENETGRLASNTRAALNAAARAAHSALASFRKKRRVSFESSVDIERPSNHNEMENGEEEGAHDYSNNGHDEDADDEDQNIHETELASSSSSSSSCSFTSSSSCSSHHLQKKNQQAQSLQQLRQMQSMPKQEQKIRAQEPWCSLTSSNSGANPASLQRRNSVRGLDAVMRNKDGSPVMPLHLSQSVSIMNLGICPIRGAKPSHGNWPIGFHSQRLYVSYHNPKNHIIYNNFITAQDEFVVLPEDAVNDDDRIVSKTASGAWVEVVRRVDQNRDKKLRRKHLTISGTYMFGLTNQIVDALIREIHPVTSLPVSKSGQLITSAKAELKIEYQSMVDRESQGISESSHSQWNNRTESKRPISRSDSFPKSNSIIATNESKICSGNGGFDEKRIANTFFDDAGGGLKWRKRKYMKYFSPPSSSVVSCNTSFLAENHDIAHILPSPSLSLSSSSGNNNEASMHTSSSVDSTDGISVSPTEQRQQQHNEIQDKQPFHLKTSPVAIPIPISSPLMFRSPEMQSLYLSGSEASLFKLSPDMITSSSQLPSPCVPEAMHLSTTKSMPSLSSLGSFSSSSNDTSGLEKKESHLSENSKGVGNYILKPSLWHSSGGDIDRQVPQE